MMVVDLSRGVFYQKCHDSECRAVDYRSPEQPLPDEICPLRDPTPELIAAEFAPLEELLVENIQAHPENYP
jgi:hypothetical protein